MLIAIIGGTGLYQMDDSIPGDRLSISTRYGSAYMQRVIIGGVEAIMLPRHGFEHGIPPHRVNYRANIAALKELGVTNILASAAVGSMAEHLPPGSLALLTQFLDFTRARSSTFFDGENDEGERPRVVHVDVTDPYCPHLRGELQDAAEAVGEKLCFQATYVCVEGPRFETPAEIRMFRQLGGDVVGMTSVPEVVLAREAGICYATVAIVTNWAAGISEQPIKHGEVGDFMKQQTPRVCSIFSYALAHHKEIACPCRSWNQ